MAKPDGFWAREKQPLQRTLVQGVIISLFIFAGVYTSLQVGFGKGKLTPDDISHQSLLDLGEVFPDYGLYDPLTGKEIKVSNLTALGPTLLVFVGQNCNASHAMAKYWRKGERGRLRPEIQLATVFSDADWTGQDTTATGLILPGARAFVTARDKQRFDDGLVSTPTFVGLDRQGRIRFISPGFDRDVNSEFINKYIGK